MFFCDSRDTVYFWLYCKVFIGLKHIHAEKAHPSIYCFLSLYQIRSISPVSYKARNLNRC